MNEGLLPENLEKQPLIIPVDFSKADGKDSPTQTNFVLWESECLFSTFFKSVNNPTKCGFQGCH